MLYRRGGDSKKMNEVILSTLYDPTISQMVSSYSVTEVVNALIKLGQGIATAGSLFIVTLIAWALVRHFMEAKEAQDYE